MLWVDALQGEPMVFQEVLEDLRQARVIYLGEIHSIPRHHELEKELLEGLTSQGLNLVLAMEQFEFFSQPALDRFNSGALDLNGLIRESDLEKRWPGQTNYHGLITAAGSHGIPVLALNARAETIRPLRPCASDLSMFASWNDSAPEVQNFNAKTQKRGDARKKKPRRPNEANRNQ